jgi:protein SDA1
VKSQRSRSAGPNL